MTNYTLQASREWWSQRWLDLLDSYRFKKRLERARNYSRQGNVLSIEFKGAKVLARVQGSEAEPYKVSLSLDPFSDEEWSYVIETMSKKAIFAAKLLAGEMPQNIEEVFTANGLSLFPFTLSDVRSKCSCPDKANPCKHVGAVYYQLGDRFSEDPFVLFKLRGRTKEQIISDLRQLRSAKIDISSTETSDIQQPVTNNQNTIKLDSFWHYNEPLDSSLVVIAPSGSETVLDVLGPIPLAKEEENIGNLTSSDVVMKYLQTVYQDVRQKAVLAAMNVGGA
ncbi:MULTISPECIES: SWIM zinc finger family protein [unclassified Tolypothrix]|uniref:SWIM zinc finger family protein n=1 Tax=unclassified Tolypothrix TaxID=2649714 RepID=UPI0005EAAF57|nr:MULTISPECIES: SWIM zinc finger family protein [unclassified Tolypothrix]BAY93451.1 zinc finger SWIM domain-containing protein [Microchaete diplosiphon NIES-3275]EKE99310.1 zinc finger protein, SWIM family [Tolypothrix sp. PCC 7601]MBE9085225.1 SWIM zinc finger family protein [Tolypothrix sp. LEGE 11397]UYD27296.1 SWIM zinc finger family protein [Tolypothrix sp. PCC 7712]UYD36844.1 SWIM zinc finger family protein [Tolypothrix sp. PCC 7601]